jgi:carboxypeptidase family protein
VSKVRVVWLVLGLAIAGATSALTPAAAMAGSISGSVTDSVSHSGIAGIQVCDRIEPFTIEETCTETDGAGSYTLGSLPAGSYYIHFSADAKNLNYVNQFYDGKESFPGDLVTIGAAEAKTGIDAQLHAGGTIAGTVTDAVSLEPVAGFPVCAFAQTASGEVGRCARTGANGEYAIHGLPTEEYEVEFLGEGEFDYLTQYWEATEDHAEFDPVQVTIPETVSGIDAALNRGAEISGTLTEVGTHRPLPNLAVTLLKPVTEEAIRTVHTDSDGHYAFRGRPAGTYVVAFSRPESMFDGDGFSTQYYKGSTTFAGATPLTIAPPEALTGIDGEVVNESPGPQPVQVSIVPTSGASHPLRCRKHFHRRRVKGRVRCVRIHRHRHHRHHR